MPTSRVSKYEPYGVAVLAELMKGDPLTLKQIRPIVAAVARTEGDRIVPHPYRVVYYLRHQLGSKVLVCQGGRHTASYKIADTLGEAHGWLTARRRNIRNQIRQTKVMVRVTLKSFDSVMTTAERHDLDLVLAALNSAEIILDASLGGSTAV